MQIEAVWLSCIFTGRPSSGVLLLNVFEPKPTGRFWDFDVSEETTSEAQTRHVTQHVTRHVTRATSIVPFFLLTKKKVPESRSISRWTNSNDGLTSPTRRIDEKKNRGSCAVSANQRLLPGTWLINCKRTEIIRIDQATSKQTWLHTNYQSLRHPSSSLLSAQRRHFKFSWSLLKLTLSRQSFALSWPSLRR